MSNIFDGLKEELDLNPHILVKETSIMSAGHGGIFNYIKTMYNLIFNKSMINFYNSYADLVRYTWVIRPDKANEMDIPATVTGMIMIPVPEMTLIGPEENWWKDVFWFEESETELNEKLKNFVPFDMADGFFCVTGFMKELQDDGSYKLGDQMYLNRENKELVPHPFTFDEYVEFILKTKGYKYFLNYYDKPESKEFIQFIEAMPKIFADFDKEYFIRLSSTNQ